MTDPIYDWRTAPAVPATDAKVAELRGMKVWHVNSKYRHELPKDTDVAVWYDHDYAAITGLRLFGSKERDRGSVDYSPTSNIAQAIELLENLPPDALPWACGDSKRDGGYWCACADWWGTATTPALAMVRAWGLAMTALATRGDALGKGKPCK
jgi:hypothetical protein